MKVLWLSNKLQTDQDTRSTGTWLDAMTQLLLASGEVELANITRGNVRDLTRQDARSIRQWVVPQARKGAMPSDQVMSQLAAAVADYTPDLIHVWGVEDSWGRLTPRWPIDAPVLLEMQGLKGAIADVYNGGLSMREQLACVGVKEVLRRSAIFRGQREFRRWGLIEREMIASHRYVTVQSEWMAAQVNAVKSTARIFTTDLALREPFLTAQAWQAPGNGALFCATSYPAPFKGLHVAIRATAILKQQYPQIKLRIAGSLRRRGVRQDGYVSWLMREIQNLGLESEVCWLGPLTAEEIITELLQSSVALIPSYIESYSVALAEAMALGVPPVVSYAGGVTSLAQDTESALFFPRGDHVMCAHQIGKLLNDPALAGKLSQNARLLALSRHDPARIVANQLAIYRQVLAENTIGQAA